MSGERIPNQYESTNDFNRKGVDMVDPAVCCTGHKQSRWLCGDYNNPESDNCQVYMAERCSKGEWDSFCDVYSKDRAGSRSTTKISKEALGGEVSVRSKFLRNTLANKYCALTADNNNNCRPTPSPFDLTQVNGPIIMKYEGDCNAECSQFTPEDLENDVVLEACLVNGMCNDVISNMIDYANRTGMSLDGTKLAHLALSNKIRDEGHVEERKEVVKPQNYGNFPYQRVEEGFGGGEKGHTSIMWILSVILILLACWVVWGN